MKLINIIAFVFLLSSNLQLYAQECFSSTFEGEGTFYDGVAGSSAGNCSLPVAAGDYFHCAMNAFDYDNSNACGACITVTGPKGTITLTVVDSCPECARGDVDMTEEAFSQIADVNDGRVPISWKYTTCENNIDNSIQVVFKEGSSDFYTAIQVRNSIHAISSMEYQLENGSWGQLVRRPYNFFLKEDETGILSPMNLRLTSVLGEQLVLDNINRVNNNVEINSNKQFSIPENCDDSILNVDTFEKEYYNIVTTEGNIITRIPKENNFSDIKLFNLAGQEIDIVTSVSNGNNISINTDKLATGIYIINLEESNNRASASKKIIIR